MYLTLVPVLYLAVMQYFPASFSNGSYNPEMFIFDEQIYHVMSLSGT